MKTILVAAILVAVPAMAGGGSRHGGNAGNAGGGRGGGVNVQGNFGPWRVNSQVNPTFLNPYQASPYATTNPYGVVTPYANPYGAFWYSVPYTLDEMPAVNRPRQREPEPEPVVVEREEKPTVIVLQAAPAPAPEPAQVQVVAVPVAPAPAPAPVVAAPVEAAPAPAAVEAKPRTPGNEVYRWVDADGVTHYSTMVPEDQKAKAKKLATLSP